MAAAAAAQQWLDDRAAATPAFEATYRGPLPQVAPGLYDHVGPTDSFGIKFSRPIAASRAKRRHLFITLRICWHPVSPSVLKWLLE